MEITTGQPHRAEDTLLLPVTGVTPGSIQILREATVITALRRDLTPHRGIPVNQGHPVPVTLLHLVRVRPHQIQAEIQAAVAEAAEEGNTI
jgi:hypothetical protein